MRTLPLSGHPAGCCLVKVCMALAVALFPIRLVPVHPIAGGRLPSNNACKLSRWLPHVAHLPPSTAKLYLRCIVGALSASEATRPSSDGLPIPGYPPTPPSRPWTSTLDHDLGRRRQGEEVMRNDVHCTKPSTDHSLPKRRRAWGLLWGGLTGPPS